MKECVHKVEVVFVDGFEWSSVCVCVCVCEIVISGVCYFGFRLLLFGPLFSLSMTLLFVSAPLPPPPPPQFDMMVVGGHMVLQDSSDFVSPAA